MIFLRISVYSTLVRSSILRFSLAKSSLMASRKSASRSYRISSLLLYIATNDIIPTWTHFNQKACGSPRLCCSVR